ncbi:T9SS type A sorting domain-containing protein, partial [candidate division KSB1 bacterium]|nr:T9SS type A sorting domain-containing protein [candidate division KSB1 bacterium]
SLNAAVITEYALAQNFPNPFNPSTSIVFDMVDAGFVSLKVYNTLGQEVAAVVNGSMDAGRHVVTFDAANLPSGMYLYRLETNGFSAQHKMLLMK